MTGPALITFFILSHERASLLERLLCSMNPLFNNSFTRVVLCDNSSRDGNNIKELSAKFNFYQTYFKPGGTQKDNFESVLDNLKTPFFCIFHDDDLVYFNHHDIDKMISVLSQVSRKNALHLINSIGVSEDLSYFEIPRKNIVKPYSIYAIPYQLPFFPAWIFQNDERTVNEWRDCINYRGFYKNTKKYSDVVLVQRLLEMSDYEYKCIPGLYLHLHHQSNDGAQIDLRSKLFLLLYTFNNSSLKQKAFYLITIFLMTFKYLLRKIASIMPIGSKYYR